MVICRLPWNSSRKLRVLAGAFKNVMATSNVTRSYCSAATSASSSRLRVQGIWFGAFGLLVLGSALRVWVKRLGAPG